MDQSDVANLAVEFNRSLIMDLRPRILELVSFATYSLISSGDVPVA